jgi:hypothetical protein
MTDMQLFYNYKMVVKNEAFVTLVINDDYGVGAKSIYFIRIELITVNRYYCYCLLQPIRQLGAW